MNAGAKKINQQAVRMAATTLILAEGSTTTLDVKIHLRKRGYQAYQSDVSDLLFAVAQGENWAMNDNGTYRVYYFPNLTALPNYRLNLPKNNSRIF
ncbi:hypothetical protein [Larkinella rosea]|uniref:Uncharacterized protein n=1 Tax=Larkinella rosea TaxID=2025312 RepID=A0A3P1BFQ1_9BACT|nr:hypothetical protein [Larkinella rosea]RRA99741.1 hypothetical protein EHT25_24215 [Larkinella rosea]